jgi:hypothetical protein
MYDQPDLAAVGLYPWMSDPWQAAEPVTDKPDRRENHARESSGWAIALRALDRLVR